MPSAVSLYGAQLFGNADSSTVVTKSNNAPGSSGDGGIDAKAAARIGYKDIDTGTRVSGSNKGRVQGICCGITAAWMSAFLAGNPEATSHSGFTGFFMGPLRFQGAYVKDFKGNASSIPSLLAGFSLKNSNPKNDSKVLDPSKVADVMPTGDVWAGYVGAYGHAIGVGSKASQYYIMEPNGGLFEYADKTKFASDLSAFLVARRNKNPNATDVPKVWLYSA